MSKKIKIIFLSLLIIFVVWAGMAFIDYVRLANERSVIFARNTQTVPSAVAEFHGIGYTILIDSGFWGHQKRCNFYLGNQSHLAEAYQTGRLVSGAYMRI